MSMTPAYLKEEENFITTASAPIEIGSVVYCYVGGGGCYNLFKIIDIDGDVLTVRGVNSWTLGKLYEVKKEDIYRKRSYPA